MPEATLSAPVQPEMLALLVLDHLELLDCLAEPGHGLICRKGVEALLEDQRQSGDDRPGLATLNRRPASPVGDIVFQVPLHHRVHHLGRRRVPGREHVLRDKVLVLLVGDKEKSRLGSMAKRSLVRKGCRFTSMRGPPQVLMFSIPGPFGRIGTRPTAHGVS